MHEYSSTVGSLPLRSAYAHPARVAYVHTACTVAAWLESLAMSLGNKPASTTDLLSRPPFSPARDLLILVAH